MFEIILVASLVFVSLWILTSSVEDALKANNMWEAIGLGVAGTLASVATAVIALYLAFVFGFFGSISYV
jgi:hypothetical protein